VRGAALEETVARYAPAVQAHLTPGEGMPRP